MVSASTVCVDCSCFIKQFLRRVISCLLFWQSHAIYSVRYFWFYAVRFDFILQAMGMCCVRCCYQVPALIRGSASVRRTLFSPSFSQFSHFWVGSSEKQFSHRLNENIRLGSVQRAVTVREGNGLQAYKGMGNWIRLFARGEWKIFV